MPAHAAPEAPVGQDHPKASALHQGVAATKPQFGTMCRIHGCRAAQIVPACKWLMMALALLVCVNFSDAATVNASSGSYADVQTAYNSASDGDAIVIPVDDETWSSQLTITKSVVFQGQTNGTIIRDGLTSSGNLFRFTLKSGHAGVLGIRFEDSGVRTDDYSSGTVFTEGGAEDAVFEIAGCHFANALNSPFRGGGWSSTRIHHNLFTNANQNIWFWNEQWQNGSWGDGSWTYPVTWGGTNCTVVEYNVFHADSTTQSTTDYYAGARVVIRFNTFRNLNIATHGTGDGSGRRRGPPQLEFYGNTFVADPPSSKNAIHVRGGRVLCWSNTYSGFIKFLTLHDYRMYADHGKFGIPDGRHLWDHMGVDDGAGTPGGAGDGIYAAGTASAGSTDETLVVSGAGWTPNQWVGYIVRVTNSAAYTRTNDDAGAVRFPPAANPIWQNYFCSSIQANTADTITVKQGAQNPRNKPFREGETWEIVKSLMRLDGIGAGQSDEMTNEQYPPIANLNQKRNPCYIWGNRNGSSIALTVAEPGVWEDFLWFEEKSGFDGSTGMGIGSTAQRTAITPSTTNAVGFFDNTENILYVWSNSVWTVDVDYSAAIGGGAPPSPPPAPPTTNRRGKAGRGHAKQVLIQ